ncbi:hypothetical protein [Nonomuraea sediminis]|uniref:hypothetical protein n=1 Tax=Nonomuraea sediminis TaxID=2835864 RepID=UPI001BDD3D45|nr:hypothetical protein [Nonomuraea sediminis]
MTTSGRRAHGEIVLGVALVMIALQLAWKFDLVRRTYFRQDDFVFITRGLENSLSWDYLMRVDYGHLVPGPFAIQWAMGRMGVYNDVLAHLVVIGLQALACLALLRLLRLLFGARPAILVPLGLYLVTPLTISSLSWWAVAIETLPFQIALPMALSSHVLYTRTGRRRHALAAAAWTLFGMAFFVKAPFILVLAVVLTLGWLRPRRTAWPLYLAVVAGYAVVFFRQLFTSVQLTNDLIKPSLPSLEVTARFAWTLLSGALVPGALGGPYRWRPIGDDYATAAPPSALVWAGLAVTAVVIAVSVFYRRRAWLAWVMLLGYFALADVVPVLIGRIQQLGPDVGGYELRYVSSTATVLAIVVGLAFIPVQGEEQPWRRPLPALRRVWFGLAAAVLVGSIWSVVAYGRLPLGRNVKSYIETARLALARAPMDAVVMDTNVPPKVAYPIFFYEYARASKLLAPIATHPVTWATQLTGPVRNPLAFDEQGRLRPVNIEGLTIPRPGCLQVKGTDTRIPLPLPLPNGEWTVQVSYLNPTPTTLSVTLGGVGTRVAAGKDLGWTFATLKSSGKELVLRTVDGRTACVGEIKVGVPLPSKTAVPTPLQPVQP